jgi:integrase
MTNLAEALDDYIALRRALGYELRDPARALPRFLEFLAREGAQFITTELALCWSQENPDASCTTQADRLAMVRQFAAWRRATDPRTEIPPLGLLPWRYQRPTPYIFSDEEIEELVSSAASLSSTTGLRGLTCSTLFGLLAVTGMRLGEAVALDRCDVDLHTGVLAIRRGKSGKSRFIPVHGTTQDALEDYSRQRDSILPTSSNPAFFVSEHGRRMTMWSAQYNFVRVSRAIGLRPPGPSDRFGRGPRLHDLRHRFAVATLIQWYRSGVDVEREMPKLATYLGHAHPDNTYWYLEAVPELLQLATEYSRRSVPGGAP